MSVDVIVCKKGGVMGLEYIVGLIVSFLIMGYLIYALLWPEKF
jgi:K+-transporting ATPase KdpF subunit